MTRARQPAGTAARRRRREDGPAQGLGRAAARPRRADLPDGARPQRPRPGRLRQGALPGGRGRGGRRGAQRGRRRDRGRGRRCAARAQRNRDLPTGEIEVLATRLEFLVALRDAALRRRGPHERHRGAAPRVPLPRPAAAGDAEELRAARRDRLPRAQGPARARLPRDRDADADALDARGRARLPGAVARAPRPVVRAAAVAAALQADPDDLGLREVLPDRPLLPRRGPARRPAVRVHADRPRDVLPDRGGRLRHGRGVPGRGVRGRRASRSRGRSRA